MTSKYDKMRAGAARRQQQSLSAMQRQSAQAQAGSAETIVWLPIDDIVIDDEIQARVGGTDPATVERYAVIMYETREWGDFPPADVHHDDERGWLLSAGFHRMAAAQLASQMLIDEGAEPISEVPTVPRPGGYAGALDHSEEDNLRNALELTNKDRYNIFKRRVLRGHRWARMTDSAIASELGVDRKTIGNWRRKLSKETGGEFSPPEPEKRIGADGKEYDVSGIRAANQQRAAEQNGYDGVDPASQPQPQSESKATSSKQSSPPSGIQIRTPGEPIGQFENPPEGDDLAVGDQVPVLAALQDFIGLAVNIAKHLEDIRDGRVTISTDLETGLYDLVVDAFDYLNGYENPRGKWIAGVVDLLETVREQMER